MTKKDCVKSLKKTYLRINVNTIVISLGILLLNGGHLHRSL